MTLRLDPLGHRHAAEILAGQDEKLAQEVIGRAWEESTLDQFLERCSRWRDDGPIREFAAVEASTERLLGGGGLNRMAPGLDPGQASLAYWVLASSRGRRLGASVARALVEVARGDPTITQLVLLIAGHNAPSRAIARGLGAIRTDVAERHPADARRTVDRWILDLE